MAGFAGGGVAAPGGNAAQANAVVNGQPGLLPGSQSSGLGNEYAEKRKRALREKQARGEPLTPDELRELNGESPYAAGGWNAQVDKDGNAIAGPVGPDFGPPTANKQLTEMRDNFLRERHGVGQPGVPQAVGQSGNTAWNEEARRVQLDNIERLRAVAEGRAPSVAEAQLKTSLLDSNQNVLGAIAARGGGAGSLRMGARQLSENARRSGLDAAIVRAGEIAAANNTLATSGNSLRTNDQALGQSDADRILEADKANQGASLDANKQRIDERQGLGELALDAQKTESQTRMNEAQIQNLKDQLKFAYAQLAAAKDQAERDFWGKVITSTIGALGGFAAAKFGND